MTQGNALPLEIQGFEALLMKPDGDPTGLAGLFNAGEIRVTRVPARLDVMGGIADYSGSNVCEGVLGRGIAIALQPRTDRTLRIRTMQARCQGLPVETRIPINYFEEGEAFRSYEEIRALCAANPVASWAAYVGGSIFTLLKEQDIRLKYGFNLLLLSGVPMNVGIGSSASTEIAALNCVQHYLGLELSESRLAELGQIAENRVVGAPCGIMDQIAVTSCRQNKLTHILCRPGSVIGEVEIPAGTGFVGINSKVKHSVAGAEYGDVRIGAFMGKKIINQHLEKAGEKPIQHLTELGVAPFENELKALLPESMRGSGFLEKYETHDDPITTISPDATYRIAGPATHPVHENARVLRFIEAMKAAASGDREALVTAGECMVGAHESYRDQCRLSVPEVEFLVEAVMKRGPEKGLYGAKITGAGSGGTVAVFGALEALDQEIPAIVEEYRRFTHLDPDVFKGTSPGAAEFGALRYHFGATGWVRT